MLRSFLCVLLWFLVSSAFSQVQEPPQWNKSDVFAPGGLVRGGDGNYYRSIRSSLARDPTKDAHVYWELFYVRANLALTVASSGQTFKDLRAAFAMVSSATIAPGVNVIIGINTAHAMFTPTYSQEFNLNAVSGSQISIVGDNPNRVHLYFSNGMNGFTVTGGHMIKSLNGMTIDGETAGAHGLLADQESTILDALLVVTGFVNGVFADRRSSIHFRQATVLGYGNGIVADHGSFIDCEFSVADGTSVGLNGTTAAYGIQANNGSQIDATACNVSHTTQVGFDCENDSRMRAAGGIANLTATGFNCDEQSSMDARSSTATNMTGYGYVATHGGRISTSSNTVSGNAHDYNLVLNKASADPSIITH